MDVTLDGKGTIILINEEKGEGIASFPNDCLLRIPCVDEVIAYKDKAYLVKQVVHSFSAVALSVVETDI